ncbi:hypothetical protein [Nocardiopsis tropica]|uniref:PQQ-binding-like beta-propeller repeat protein n=1 Tax=Nocardiopsis tropica TaxID=109330 RepID=A0ABU7KJA7_9ACTN|nr:hypothetical protein [Nocardiopsis umidischolae]MEE2049381.1 PQQ-binding-like beta-propeller repeat protein [Nocardiopsis umidischolae]
MTRFFNVSLVLIVLFSSSCSLAGSDSRSDDRVSENLDPQESFSEVAWEWEESSGSEVARVVPVSVGVAVLFEDGVTVLSGESGEEIWSRRETLEAVGIAGNGEFIVVETDEGLSMLDPGGGEVVHEVAGAEMEDQLLITSEQRLIWKPDSEASRGRLSAISLEENTELWSGLEGLRCDSDPELPVYTGSARLVGEVITLMYTCAEYSSNSEALAAGLDRVEENEVVSGIIGIDSANGEELWRFEEFIEGSVSHSYNRDVSRVSNNHLVVRTMGEGDVFLDARNGEEIPGGTNVLASSDDLSWLVMRRGDGVFVRVGENMEVEEVIDFSDLGEDLDQESGFIVLDDGLGFVSGSGSASEAVFRPWGGNIEEARIGLENAVSEVNDVISAPGVIVVSYIDGEGRSVLIGLT